MRKSVYSNGKLLISGEYLVLNGAKALAVPLKVGQETIISEGNKKDILSWYSHENGNSWFEARFQTSGFGIRETTDINKAAYVQDLLLHVKNANPVFLEGRDSLEIRNELGFNHQWGFGSSSTLIYNMSTLFGVDPYKLNKIITGGSGFDIACAGAKNPLLYQVDGEKHFVEECKFDPSFSTNLYFIWLGNKKNTSQSVTWFKKNIQPKQKDIEEITGISQEMLQVKELPVFMELMEKHNSALENVLGVASVQKQYFNDFTGTIKPLGAWGGDFILAASDSEKEEVFNYFNRKGLSTILGWDELVI